MTGQLVIQYIGNKLNGFLNERLKTSGVDRIIAQDTDSVSGSSMIRTSRGMHSIESLYDNLEGPVKQIRENHFVKEIDGLSVESYSNQRGVEFKPVTYIMKHLVEKTMLRVRCRDNDVRVTEDHSIVIYRDGKTVSESALNLLDSDLLICRHDDGGIALGHNYSVTTLGICSEWVYDIEVEDNHNFFANDILVHNSCYLNLEDLVKKIVPAGTESDKIVDFIDRFITTYIDPFVESSFDDLAKYLNSFENKMSMKREAIADKALWRKKKHYVLRVFDNEGVRYATPQLKIMGIETARSSTPEFVRKALKESIEIIMADDKERLIQFVEELRTKFFSIPVEEIASPRGVSDIDKWKDTDHTWKLGAPIHVKAAILFNRLIEKYSLQNQYPELKNGDKLKFVPLIKQNPVHCNVVGFIDRLPTEFGLERYVDRESQFQSVFLKPLESLTSIIHWNIVEVNTLESFFS